MDIDDFLDTLVADFVLFKDVDCRDLDCFEVPVILLLFTELLDFFDVLLDDFVDVVSEPDNDDVDADNVLPDNEDLEETLLDPANVVDEPLSVTV